MEELTLERLIDLTRSCAGADEGELDGDIVDVLFENLGYDSVALLEVLSQIRHQYGIDLADETIGRQKTPREVVETVNQVIRSKTGPSASVEEEQSMAANEGAGNRPTRPIPDNLHAQHLIMLACSGRLSQIVNVLVELRVADALEGGPLPVDELAAKVEADATSLYRVLRCAAAVGIFEEGPKRVFGLTALADGLRANNPEGVLPLVKYNSMELTNRPYGEILHSVKTGAPVFERVFGISFGRYLEQNPEIDAFYDSFMSHWSRQFADEELEVWDLGRFTRIADLGGGDGYFLAQVLKKHPHVTGHLVDLPWMAGKAEAVLAEQGVAERVTVQIGNLFTDPIPDGCDAYFLKAVLHDLSDDEAGLILRRVRERIGDSDARLLVVDSVLDPGNAWDHGKFLDIDMLVLHGGRERTWDDWHALFAAAKFELVSEPIYHWTLLECRPI